MNSEGVGSLEHLGGVLLESTVTSLISGLTTMNDVSYPLQNTQSIHCGAEPALHLPQHSDLMSFQ